MRDIHQAGLFVGGIAALAMASAAHATGFVPGRIYSSRDGGFVEWNTALEVQRSVAVPLLESATGIVFNGAGNLVMIARYDRQVKLLEVTGAGQVVRSTVLQTGGSLLRGSYVDYDALTNRYIVAEDHRLRLLDGNFASLGTTANLFERASGVAFGADGRIYATDQFTGNLSVFSATLQALPPASIGGWVRTGMELANNGDLLLTSFGDGRIQRRGANGSISTLVSGLGYGNLSDVDQLPDGRIVSISANNTLKLYTEAGQLLASGSYPEFGDGVVYFVPAPWGAAALLMGTVGAGRRRR